jgi:hypothetical protein
MRLPTLKWSVEVLGFFLAIAAALFCP